MCEWPRTSTVIVNVSCEIAAVARLLACSADATPLFDAGQFNAGWQKLEKAFGGMANLQSYSLGHIFRKFLFMIHVCFPIHIWHE